MMIDGKENPIAKMVIGILSTLSEKTVKEWKIISHIILFSNYFISVVNTTITS
jgi:hypothetical protein